MARKHRPRWGYRPPGFKQVAPFSLEQARHLAEIAGRSNPQSVKKLHRQLNEESDAIAVVGYIYESEVSPPEQRAALNVLIDHSSRLLNGLREADLDTRIVLGDPLPKNVEILPNPTAIAEALHPCNADQEDTDPPSPQPTKCVQCDEPIPSGEQTVQVAGNWVLHPRCYDDYMGFDRSKDDKRGTDIPDIPPILDRRQRPIRPHTEKIEK